MSAAAYRGAHNDEDVSAAVRLVAAGVEVHETLVNLLDRLALSLLHRLRPVRVHLHQVAHLRHTRLTTALSAQQSSRCHTHHWQTTA